MRKCLKKKKHFLHFEIKSRPSFILTILPNVLKPNPFHALLPIISNSMREWNSRWIYLKISKCKSWDQTGASRRISAREDKRHKGQMKKKIKSVRTVVIFRGNLSRMACSRKVGHVLITLRSGGRVQGRDHGARSRPSLEERARERASERHEARMVVSEGTEHALTVLRTGRWFSGSLVSASPSRQERTVCPARHRGKRSPPRAPARCTRLSPPGALVKIASLCTGDASSGNVRVFRVFDKHFPG
jgi:hypothetical protein